MLDGSIFILRGNKHTPRHTLSHWQSIHRIASIRCSLIKWPKRYQNISSILECSCIGQCKFSESNVEVFVPKHWQFATCPPDSFRTEEKVAYRGEASMTKDWSKIQSLSNYCLRWRTETLNSDRFFLLPSHSFVVVKLVNRFYLSIWISDWCVFRRFSLHQYWHTI